MINYRFDETIIDVQETRVGAETEFRIRLLQSNPYAERLKEVQRLFDDNEDYTDVLFYAYTDHTYKIIVRDEHVADFLAALFKARLIQSLAWTEK